MAFYVLIIRFRRLIVAQSLSCCLDISSESEAVGVSVAADSVASEVSSVSCLRGPQSPRTYNRIFDRDASYELLSATASLRHVFAWNLDDNPGWS